MKSNRQKKILEIINKQDIDTQEDIVKILNDEGFNVTQATVSRDIRELNLTKVSVNGKQKYTTTANKTMNLNNKYIRVLKDGIINVETAGNMLVIKTVPGMAMAVGAAVDAMNIKEIVGCIAGDDTIMCAIKRIEDVKVVKIIIEKSIR